MTSAERELRTFPLRLAPIEGEALDSWCEALAVRLSTPLGDVMKALSGPAVESDADSRGLPAYTRWIMSMTDAEVKRVAYITGTPPATIARMLLSHYHGRALLMEPESGRVNRRALWGRGSRSRYCPDCLADTGGRWRLSWRLGWSFACVEHERLLADICPGCTTPQRQRHNAISQRGIPELGRCGNTVTVEEPQRRQRCGHDLTRASTLSLTGSHPALQVQELLNTAIESDTAAFGLYALSPQRAARMLSDTRALAGVILDLPAQRFAGMLPLDLVSAHEETNRSMKVLSAGRTRAGFTAPAEAASAAFAATTALKILCQPDAGAAGRLLRPFLEELRGKRAQISATTIGRMSRNSSPVLEAVGLAALGPTLAAAQQVRFRTVSAFPRLPAPHRDPSRARNRKIPVMVWPSWALRVRPSDGITLQTLQPALAGILLLPGSSKNWTQTARLVGSATDGPTLSRVLQILRDTPEWPAIHCALDHLAAFLDAADVPIDYTRRRRLDYRDLLPEDEWVEIARSVDVHPGQGWRVKIVRNVLFRQVSGLSWHLAPPAACENSSNFTNAVVGFWKLQTPELAHALDCAAQSFLARQGIRNEPTSWHPPAELTRGLALPGVDSGQNDLAELHRLIREEDRAVPAAARRLRLDLDTACNLLREHPAPALPRQNRSAPGTGSVMEAARRSVSPVRFEELYVTQGQPLDQVATATGFTKTTLTRLAAEYGIPMRKRADYKPRGVVDRDWLFREYVENRRTLPELAREKGMSVMNMNRWAHAHGIPLRARGGASHRARVHRGAD
ncbi:TniQ family protein [Streptomyces sp. NPDC088817]|uniref:TniQ family protein n=1 Tax=Streptomyces sp. NPDC088817 TaxID=3365907 RepID=UPI00380BAE44